MNRIEQQNKILMQQLQEMKQELIQERYAGQALLGFHGSIASNQFLLCFVPIKTAKISNSLFCNALLIIYNI